MVSVEFDRMSIISPHRLHFKTRRSSYVTCGSQRILDTSQKWWKHRQKNDRGSRTLLREDSTMKSAGSEDRKVSCGACETKFLSWYFVWVMSFMFTWKTILESSLGGVVWILSTRDERKFGWAGEEKRRTSEKERTQVCQSIDQHPTTMPCEKRF